MELLSLRFNHQQQQQTHTGPLARGRCITRVTFIASYSHSRHL